MWFAKPKWMLLQIQSILKAFGVEDQLALLNHTHF